MRERTLMAWFPGIVLLVGFFVVLQGTRGQATVPLAAPLEGVLATVDGYRIENQVVSDEERRIAGMSDYVARLYFSDTTLAFSTYVGYYERQTQGKTIHSPRNCLPGAGWEIVDKRTMPVISATGSHVVNRFLLKNGTSLAAVYYWYQGRGRVVANEYAVKVNLLRDAALKGHTEEALVRLVVPVYGADSAHGRADALALHILPRLMNDVDRVLPGNGSAPALTEGGAVPHARLALVRGE